MSNRKPLTQEEFAWEALAINICKRFSILDEERPVIETMAYSDKYKKILDGIVMDKIKLDEEIKKEEEAIKQRGGEKSQLGITMLNHSKGEPIGVLKDVMCQVGVTAIIAKFLILDMPIDRDVPILTFRAAKTSLNTKESDCDYEEDYGIQTNSFGAPMYGPKRAKYLNCNDPMDQTIALQEVINPFRKICVWKKAVGFLGSLPVPLQHMEWKPDYKGNFLAEKTFSQKYVALLMKCAFNDLQQCYLQERCHLVNPIENNNKKDFDVVQREGYSSGLSDFQSVLSTFTQYSRLRVIAKLRHGELYHSANIVSRYHYSCKASIAFFI
nr:E3 ubiquitin-protein ligase COP1-like isoform X2 [Tanacetum cinerariifolium]